MKPSEMAGLIEENFENQKHALMFEGSPGIGKTAVLDQVAEKLSTKYDKWYYRTIILSQFESVDLRGIPSVFTGEQRTTVWNPPADLMFPMDAHGIIFFDEIPNATQDVQKAVQQYIHSGKLGDLVKPPGMMVVGAGNRTTDRAGANRMPTALANRFEWHAVDADLEDWSKWALKAGIDHSVIAYLNKMGIQHFNAFDPTKNINPTPRTWEKVSNVLSSKFRAERICGLVGKGPGSEFIAFNNIWRELPDRQEIYRNPTKALLPDKSKADIRYAICSALAYSANKNNYAASLRYVERMEREWQTHFTKGANMVNPDMNKQPEFLAWMGKNKDLLTLE